MKCTNCGRNEANYHYRYNVNGKVTEAHLCPDCAAKMGETVNTGDFFPDFDRMFEDMFEGFFGRGFMMPALMGPRVETRNAQAQPEIGTARPLDPVQTDELAKRRQLNALREEMHQAAEREDFEKAAQLRDQIKRLEK